MVNALPRFVDGNWLSEIVKCGLGDGLLRYLGRGEVVRGTVEKETAGKRIQPAASRETVIRVSRLYVEVSLVFDFIVWEYFYVFLII